MHKISPLVVKPCSTYKVMWCMTTKERCMKILSAPSWLQSCTDAKCNCCSKTHLDGGVMSTFVFLLTTIAWALTLTNIGGIALGKSSQRFWLHHSDHCCTDTYCLGGEVLSTFVFSLATSAHFDLTVIGDMIIMCRVLIGENSTNHQLSHL